MRQRPLNRQLRLDCRFQRSVLTRQLCGLRGCQDSSTSAGRLEVRPWAGRLLFWRRRRLPLRRRSWLARPADSLVSCWWPVGSVVVKSCWDARRRSGRCQGPTRRRGGRRAVGGLRDPEVARTHPAGHCEQVNKGDGQELGEVHGHRKFAVLRAADVFVLTSYSEGLPVAVLEAMASRCPVIVSRNCNLTDVQDKRVGWLVSPEVKSVFLGLKEAAASPDERRNRGENGRRLVEETYTWERIARRSIALYGADRFHIN